MKSIIVIINKYLRASDYHLTCEHAGKAGKAGKKEFFWPHMLYFFMQYKNSRDRDFFFILFFLILFKIFIFFFVGGRY